MELVDWHTCVNGMKTLLPDHRYHILILIEVDVLVVYETVWMRQFGVWQMHGCKCFLIHVNLHVECFSACFLRSVANATEDEEVDLLDSTIALGTSAVYSPLFRLMMSGGEWNDACLAKAKTLS